MQSKMLKDVWEEGPVYALVFETGDEVIEGITAFAKQNDVNTAHFTAIGAFSDATIAWFDPSKKDYRHNPIKEQVEAAALIGDVTLSDGEPRVHAHVVLGRQDGSTFAGHLIEAHVRPTLELFLTQVPQRLQRKINPESSLPLIHIPVEK